MLKTNNIHVYYGHIHALKGISIHVPHGKIVALLGANGAGKSTTLKTISGMIIPKEGSIQFDNNIMRKRKPSLFVKQGIVHCVEDRGIFPNFTVEENLQIGAYTRKSTEIDADLEKVYAFFPRLKERKQQKGATLSGGEAQMLAIGRSLMARPKLLLLDEPSLGVAPIIIKEIFDIILQIKQSGVSILLVEQNVHLALQIADYGYVLENGKLALEGSANQLQNNHELKQLYLGEKV